MKSITVIIPHYNSTDLERLLNSIPNKRWIKTIVVDDHSTKPLSQMMMDKFKHVKFVSNLEGKKGPGSARNKGIEMANSDWVMFADSDDYFVNGAFELIKSNLDSKDELIVFPVESVNTDKMTTGARHLFINRQISKYKESGNRGHLLQFLPTWSLLISKSLIDRETIRYDEIMTAEDMIVSSKVKCFANAIKIENKAIYCVTESGDSLMTKKSKELALQRFYATCRNNRFLINQGFGKYQTPINIELLALKEYGLLLLLKSTIYAVKNKSSIFRGIKHLISKM